ncbi:MAG: IPT/TIG domain-containing protein [Actinomycetota bacterium]
MAAVPGAVRRRVGRRPEMGDAPGQRGEDRLPVPGHGAGGTEVVANGSGFGNSRQNDSYVKFGRIVATEYISWSDTRIRRRVPPGVSGTVEVRVTRIFHKWGPITVQGTSNGKDFTGTGGGGARETQLSGIPHLNAVDSLDASHVWAVGAGGTILFYNGSTWASQTSGTTNPLYDVRAVDANRVYAVGNRGASLYHNGSSWFESPIGFTGDLKGMYAADANHIWVVGNDGKIIYWNGSYWADQESGTTQNLYSIEGTGAGNVWAVGDAGTILHLGWGLVEKGHRGDHGEFRRRVGEARR